MHYNSTGRQKSGRSVVTSYNAVTWLLDRNVEEGRGDREDSFDEISRPTLEDMAESPSLRGVTL